MLTKKQLLKKHVKRVWLALQRRPRNAIPAFIFGMQRSGTNMLLYTLARSPDVEAINETDPEAFAECRLQRGVLDAKLVQKSRSRIVLLKPMCDSQHAASILRSHVSSKGLWIYRGLDDVVNSGLRQWKDHVSYLETMRNAPDRAGWRSEAVDDRELRLVDWVLENARDDSSSRAAIWYLRNVLYFRQKLHENERVRLVKYEDVVLRPQGNVKMLCSWLGIRYSSKIPRGIHSKSIGKNRPSVINEVLREKCDSLMSRMDDHKGTI